MDDPGAARMECIGLRAHHRATFSLLATSEDINTDIPFSRSSPTCVEVWIANSIYAYSWGLVSFFSSFGPMKHSSGGQGTSLICILTLNRGCSGNEKRCL